MKKAKKVVPVKEVKKVEEIKKSGPPKNKQGEVLIGKKRNKLGANEIEGFDPIVK